MTELLTRQSFPTRDGFTRAVCFTLARLPLAQFLRSGE